jgi:hypothetical protein
MEAATAFSLASLANDAGPGRFPFFEKLDPTLQPASYTV